MLDKNSINMLLSLNDDQLTKVIKKIASDAGIDPTTLNIGSKELLGLRTALSGATDSDIARAGELLKQFKNGNKNG